MPRNRPGKIFTDPTASTYALMKKHVAIQRPIEATSVNLCGAMHGALAVLHQSPRHSPVAARGSPFIS